ncbi:hypothetical protein K402DRAFT_423260 [Aulographum hederae CBS 113979]|uniref:Uncharacterized protein n=1 Tax=Aulographum hederae CBS 113979 TaxID=1176131 RepID=A0A6G1GSL1_9PEZI|nr:hypothetical protein K402DRAFT_423260 [Aulographum hederae CBS 113979]
MPTYANITLSILSQHGAAPLEEFVPLPPSPPPSSSTSPRQTKQTSTSPSASVSVSTPKKQEEPHIVLLDQPRRLVSVYTGFDFGSNFWLGWRIDGPPVKPDRVVEEEELKSSPLLTEGGGSDLDGGGGSVVGEVPGAFPAPGAEEEAAGRRLREESLRRVRAGLPSLGEKMRKHLETVPGEARRTNVEKIFLVFKMLVDGREIATWCGGAKNEIKGNVMFGLVDGEGGDCFERRVFCFPKNPKFAKGEKRRQRTEGMMEIRVFRADGKKKVRAEVKKWAVENPISFIDFVDGGMVEKQRQTRFYKFRLVDPRDNPYVTFRYYFRTWAKLRSMGIIEGVDPKGLSPAVAVSLASSSPSTPSRGVRNRKASFEDSDSGSDDTLKGSPLSSSRGVFDPDASHMTNGASRSQAFRPLPPRPNAPQASPISQGYSPQNDRLEPEPGIVEHTLNFIRDAHINSGGDESTYNATVASVLSSLRQTQLSEADGSPSPINSSRYLRVPGSSHHRGDSPTLPRNPALVLDESSPLGRRGSAIRRKTLEQTANDQSSPTSSSPLGQNQRPARNWLSRRRAQASLEDLKEQEEPPSPSPKPPSTMKRLSFPPKAIFPPPTKSVHFEHNLSGRPRDPSPPRPVPGAYIDSPDVDVFNERAWLNRTPSPVRNEILAVGLERPASPPMGKKRDSSMVILSDVAEAAVLRKMKLGPYGEEK